MENFVVSARKYRPLGFEEVVGQEHITTTLENAIKSNHLGQALLFCGPRGPHFIFGTRVRLLSWIPQDPGDAIIVCPSFYINAGMKGIAATKYKDSMSKNKDFTAKTIKIICQNTKLIVSKIKII